MKPATPRRLTGAVLALGLAFGASACGDTSEAGSSDDVNVAFVYATTTLNPMQEMAFGSTAAADEKGVKLTSSAPSGNDGAAQVQLFQSAGPLTAAGWRRHPAATSKRAQIN